MFTVMDVQNSLSPPLPKQQFSPKAKTSSKSPIGNPLRCRPLSCSPAVVDFAVLMH
jgi:hypothetical protein